MKKILFILCAVMILAACDGKSGGKKLEDKLYGEWHSTSLTVTADIYLSFTEEKTFEIYQQIGEGAYRLYRGTWNLEEGVLMGRYNDGEDWASSYLVTIEDNVLTMTSQNDAAEVSTYSSGTIPEEVRNGCEVVVKSSEAGF